MANFFDSNMQKLDRGGTMAKKMTARRQTKKVDGTMLSRQKNVSCIVTGYEYLFLILQGSLSYLELIHEIRLIINYLDGYYDLSF